MNINIFKFITYWLLLLNSDAAFCPIQSLAAGLVQHRPADELCYLQQCLDTVAEIGWKNVKYDTFLSDISDLSVALESTGICV